MFRIGKFILIYQQETSHKGLVKQKSGETLFENKSRKWIPLQLKIYDDMQKYRVEFENEIAN